VSDSRKKLQATLQKHKEKFRKEDFNHLWVLFDEICDFEADLLLTFIAEVVVDAVDGEYENWEKMGNSG
jgi:hypothetical protein